MARAKELLLRRGLLSATAAAAPQAPRLARLAAEGVGAGAGAGSEPPPLERGATPYLMESSVEAAAPQPRWRPLGPFAIPHGQTYGSGPGSRPPVAGRVAAVAIDPSDSRHLLVGSGGGGIWESRDRGATWSPRTDFLLSLSIGALAFHSSDPRIVYAGTGEGDTDSPLGVGFLRSDDGGASWSRIAESVFAGLAFFDLQVDPEDGDHLLAATTGGLYESMNGGFAWERVLGATTWSVSFEPVRPRSRRPDRERLAASASGLMRSSRLDPVWRPVALPPMPGTLSRAAVCHAPSKGGVAFLFAAADQLVQDADGNRSWQSVPSLLRRAAANRRFQLLPVSDLPLDLNAGQAFYDWYVRVPPDDPEMLYLGAIDLHRGRRTETGWTWENLSARPSGDSIHPDQHALAFDARRPETLVAANDGGVYLSEDRGYSWRSLNSGLAIAEVEYLSQHPEVETWLLAGTQDNGTLRGEGQGVWYLVRDGDGGDCGVCADAPQVCFHSFYGMGLERSIGGGAWDSWEEVTPGFSAAETYPRGSLFYPPVEVCQSVVAQAGRAIYVSVQRGDPGSWTAEGLPPEAGRASALSIPRTDTIYAATEEGNVYRIDRDGDLWFRPRELASPAPQRFLSDLLADPTPRDRDRLWATCSHLANPGVFRSDDGGESWLDLTAALPLRLPFNAIEIDPANPDTVFVAADRGVYRSDDAGASWSPFFAALPNAVVHDLVFQPRARLLRAGTQSRGVWEVPVDGLSAPEVAIYLRDHAADAGRVVPSPTGLVDPFEPEARADWRRSPDIKVDVEPFVSPLLGGVDPELFEDDRPMVDRGIDFASGLRAEAVRSGEPARVYVQVHNRGRGAAREVAVSVFRATARQGVPDLDASFWPDFEAGRPHVGPAWASIGRRSAGVTIAPDGAAVFAFEWEVPSVGAETSAFVLLAVADAADDPCVSRETEIEAVVRTSAKCALRRIGVVGA